MELYRQFLDCGYSPVLFTELSPAEVVNVIESANRRQERQDQEYMLKLRNDVVVKDAAIKVYLNNLGCMMSGDQNDKCVSLSNMFESFFQTVLSGLETIDGAAISQNANALSPEMQLYKAQRLDHAYRHNVRRKEGQNDGSGNA